MSASPHPPLRVDPERCKGCELCVVVCRQQVLTMSAGLDASRRRIAENTAPERCDRCGRCVLICPDGAITDRD